MLYGSLGLKSDRHLAYSNYILCIVPVQCSLYFLTCTHDNRELSIGKIERGRFRHGLNRNKHYSNRKREREWFQETCHPFGRMCKRRISFRLNGFLRKTHSHGEAARKKNALSYIQSMTIKIDYQRTNWNILLVFPTQECLDYSSPTLPFFLF